MQLNRRQFNMMLAAGLGTLAAPVPLLGQAKPKVVVIGGGAGGATAAHYIARDSKGEIDVTLVDASKTYTTCFYSNLYLGGFRTFDSITHSFDKLGSEFGINIVNGFATEIDRAGKMVKLQDGTSLAYDRVVVSPGIDVLYDSVPGYSEEASKIAPHALMRWKMVRV